MGWWALAVDMGATSVAAAVRERARIEVVKFAGRETLPPTVFCPDGRPPLAGLPIAERAVSEPGRAVLSPKRALSDSDMVSVGGAALPLAEIYAALLTAVLEEAARGRKRARPRRLILTYPADWEDRQLAVLCRAAYDAGLPAPALVAEPIAAAWELAADSMPGQFVAILDVSGESIDAAVLRRTADGFELAGPPGSMTRPAGDAAETTLPEGADELLAAIAGAGLTPDQLAAIHLTGDGSRARSIADVITQTLNIRPQMASSPESVMVRGAAAAVLGPPRRRVSGWRIPRRATPAAARPAVSQEPGSARDHQQPRLPRPGRRGLFAFAVTAVALAVLTTLLLPHLRSSARSAPAPAHITPAPAQTTPAAPAAATPAPAQATSAPAVAVNSGLSGVSCTSPAACTAVGNSGNALLAERWDGATWTIQPTPKPPGVVSTQLSSVSCTSSTACTAVGNSVTDATAAPADAVTAPLAERWDGTNWTIQPTPKPPGVVSAQLSSVSCTSSTACTAVGSAGSTSLAERWNGTNWAIQPTPRPPGAIYKFTSLRSVSCTSPISCTAVGNSDTGLPYTGTDTTDLSLAETWNGTKWTIQPMVQPAAPTQTSFSGVSCTSPAACTAVGTIEPANVPSAVLAEKWDGETWTAAPSPSPPDGGWLADVSCPSSATCTAVGGENSGPLAEVQNGTKWTITPTAQPGGVLYPSLKGVSCTSPTACIAVGQVGNNSNTAEGALAEKWNGLSWTVIQTTSSPPPTPSASRPVLFDASGGPEPAWTYPRIQPEFFYLNTADSRDDNEKNINDITWAYWNSTTAVTSSATYQYLSGPCCTPSNWHYRKVTMTLSDIQYSRGPDPEPYFSRIVIVGEGIRTITLTYNVSLVNGTLTGSWTGGPP
jgi:hypothetical protein